MASDPRAIPSSKPRVLLASIEMGYGHMRAAHALAEAMHIPVQRVDEFPLADVAERQQWQRARSSYEFISRASQLRGIGGPMEAALGALTAIPGLYPRRDLSRKTMAVHYLERQAARGLGRGLIEHLERSGQALLTTFFAPALLADLANIEHVFCVVTDTDVHRIWAPFEGSRSRIHYFVPSHRTARRLAAYGVPEWRLTITGFPLPPSLLGGPSQAQLRVNLAARVARLDPSARYRTAHMGELPYSFASPEHQADGPPHVVFAVGGAGAQAELATRFLGRFRAPIEAGKLRLTLVAGVRQPIADRFHTSIRRAGLEHQLEHGLSVLHAPDMDTYFDRFNRLMAHTDVLWTKPSELTFFGALGIPLLLAPAVGRHEVYNRRWIREMGAAFSQGEPEWVADRLLDWLDDGSLAGAAVAGYLRMPKSGTYDIIERVHDAIAAGER